MATQPHQLNFAPIYRTSQVENLHEQVKQNDLEDEQQQQSIPSTRKILIKHMTVIGDGSDIDMCEIKTQS